MRVSRLSLVLGVTGWILAAIFAAMLAMSIPLQSHIGVGDTLNVKVLGTLPDLPISGDFVVLESGRVDLGQPYGSVTVAGLTLGETQKEIHNHLQQFLTSPESAVMLAQSATGLSIRHSLPQLGWFVALGLVLLLALTFVRSYTIAEPRRVGIQFSLSTVFFLMVIVALAVFAFIERR